MSRFRKTAPRTVPSLNTAALPDLIFTLLFFFMLVANLRTAPALTQFHVPDAGELQKLKEKSLTIFIIVGRQDETKPDDLPPIQLNSGFVRLDELPEKLNELKNKAKPEDLHKLVVILKIDKKTHMGLVNDIRQILREANLLTVFYSAEKNRKD
jgi:biopolymer transport protein ExbD